MVFCFKSANHNGGSLNFAKTSLIYHWKYSIMVGKCVIRSLNASPDYSMRHPATQCVIHSLNVSSIHLIRRPIIQYILHEQYPRDSSACFMPDAYADRGVYAGVKICNPGVHPNCIPGRISQFRCTGEWRETTPAYMLRCSPGNKSETWGKFKDVDKRMVLRELWWKEFCRMR